MKVAAVALAAVLVIGASVTASAAEFDDYNPPKALSISWFDYLKDGGGSPSPGNLPTEWPRWSVDFPYRAVFFGARKATSSTQRHNSWVYVVFSKVPVTSLFTFSYTSFKPNTSSGYITARYNSDLVGTVGPGQPERDYRILYNNWTGVNAGVVLTDIWSYTAWNSDNFKFDFYYECEPHDKTINGQTLEIRGLRGITSCPYNYILTCNPGGDRPSSSGAESSSSSGSSSGSSGGESSGGESSGGESSGDESSEEESSLQPDPPDPSDPEASFPDPIDPSGPHESNVPDLPSGGNTGQGSTGDTGENGGGWTLPGWGNEDVTGEAGGFQDLQPGGSGDWGAVEIKPGGSGEWGASEILPGGSGDWGSVEIKPGGSGSWGFSDWGTGTEQSLYDFGWW